MRWNLPNYENEGNDPSSHNKFCKSSKKLNRFIDNWSDVTHMLYTSGIAIGLHCLVCDNFNYYSYYILVPLFIAGLVSDWRIHGLLISWRGIE